MNVRIMTAPKYQSRLKELEISNQGLRRRSGEPGLRVHIGFRVLGGFRGSYYKLGLGFRV